MAVKLAFDKISCQGVKKFDLLVCHGLLGNRLNFRSLSKRTEMSGEADVYLVDLRNHGQSPHVDSMKPADFSADLMKFCDDQGIENPVLFGHSMGGKACIKTALDHPDRVRGLIVGDVGPFDYTKFQGVETSNLSILQYLHELNFDVLKTKDQVRLELMKFTNNKKTMVEFFLTNIEAKDGERLRWRVNLPVLMKDYFEYSSYTPTLKEKYFGPTKLIYGTKSEYAPAARIPEFKKYFPNFDIQNDAKAIEAGHWIHFAEPEIFLSHFKSVMSSIA